MMNENTLRRAFNQFNKIMILMWRLGLGAWINSAPEAAGRIMVLTTTGRKSGLKRRAPVNYIRLDGDVYCVGGFGAATQWYRNIKADPQIELWLPDGWWAGHAQDVTDPETRLTMLRRVLANSGFAAETFGAINPHTISDAELEADAADWPVVHVRLERALSGPGGPGDLAWAWPVAALGATVGAWLWQRRRSAV
jgi:deazaflavin-dependent oxidoreductase (nitroreductase family)